MWGAIIGLAASVGGALLSKKKADTQADTVKDNAAAMKAEADYQKFRTSVLLKRQQEYTTKLLSSQRVAYAKAGIRVDTGTALHVAESSLLQSEEDAQLIRMEGEFNVNRAMAGAQMYDQQASDMRKAGYIEAGGTLLTSGWDFAQNMGWV